MIDCLSNGRLISGFARGIPREYQVHNVPLPSRARASRRRTRSSPARGRRRCSPTRASSGPTGRGDLAAAGAAAASADLGPVVGSKEIDRVRRAAQHADHARPRAARGLRDDIIRYYAKCLAANGHQHHAGSPVARPDRLRRRQQGAGGEGVRALSSSISTARCSATATSPRPPAAPGRATRRKPRLDYVRPENLRAVAELAREDFRNMTMEDVDARWPSTCRGARRTRSPSASSRSPSTPAPTPCRSASIAARMPQETVHRADPPLRARGAADAAGAPGAAGEAGGGVT